MFHATKLVPFLALIGVPFGEPQMPLRVQNPAPALATDWVPDVSSTLGSSIAWGDWDGDRRLDVLVRSPNGSLILLAQIPGGSFRDATAEAGLEALRGVCAVTWQDFDGDGRPDLFVAIPSGDSRLLRNVAPGSFEAVQDSGLDLSLGIRDAHWIDFDRDDALDLLLLRADAATLWRRTGAACFEEILLEIPLVANPLATAQAVPATGDLEPTGGGSTEAGTGGGSMSLVGCIKTIDDFSTPNCLQASSDPLLGMLYPISPDLYVDAKTGYVGMGMTAPSQRLDVFGSVRAADRFISSTTIGPPLIVSSDDLVENLNSDLLDGYHATDLIEVPIDTNELAGDAVTTVKIKDQNVRTPDLADTAVTTEKIAGQAVTTQKIADGAVTGAKINQMDAAENEVLTWTGSTWEPQVETDPTWDGPADAVSDIARTGNVSIGGLEPSANWKLMIHTGPNDGGVILTNDSIGRTGIRIDNETGAGPPLSIFDSSSEWVTFQSNSIASPRAVQISHLGNGTALEVHSQGGDTPALYVVKTGSGYAGHFQGDVLIEGDLIVGGTITKGGGSFKIDHPLNPENKYLYHSFVESPDMMNIYNGNVQTDAAGKIWV